MRFVALVLLLGGCDAVLDFDKLRHGHGDGGNGPGSDGGATCKVPAAGPFFDYAHPSEQALNQYAYAMTLTDVAGQLAIATLEGDNKVHTYVESARSVKASASVGTGCSAFNFNASLASGDFDGDHIADLAAGCADTLDTPQASLDLLLGTAAGSFASARPFATQATNPNASVTADLDGDGSSDLVVVDTKAPAGVDVYFGVPGGGDFTTSAPLRLSLSSGVPANVLTARLGDDGDPVLDLLVLAIDPDTSAGHVEIFRRDRTNPRSFFAGPEKITIPAGDAVVIGAGNLDTDGRPDLLVADDGGTLYVFTGQKSTDGTTSYTTPSSMLNTPTYSYQMAVGDLNCDGLDDVVLTHDPLNSADDEDAYEVWTSSGDTLTAVGTPFDDPTVNSPNTSYVKIADIDADGVPDIVMTIDNRAVGMNYSSFRILYGMTQAP